MKDKNELVFKATPVKRVFERDGFRIYAMEINQSAYPFIKLNSFNNVSISGDLPILTSGIEYEITAVPEYGKYGCTYKVKNIRRDVHRSGEDVLTFLSQILPVRQATTLYNVYPDIVQRVKDNNLSDIDLSKLPGIKKKTFAKICREIIKSEILFDIIAEFKGLLSMSMLTKIYKVYPSVEILRLKLKTEPYTTLMRVDGIGFKKADAITIEMQKEGVIDFGYNVKESVDRCLACIVYILQQNENEGNTKTNLAYVRKQCLELVPACANHFAEAIKSDSIYYDKSTMDIALKRTYKTERKIAIAIAGGLNNTYNVWDYDVEKYRRVGDFDLTDEQIQMLRNVCNNNICILNGFAGSGKSASTQALINMLEDNDKSYLILAPTGKASKVISEYTGKKASTIHRGLGYSPDGGWCFDEDNKLRQDIVIVDESSMVGVNLFSHLIDAIDFETTKLLLIGDNAQLCSIGCGNLLHDFMNSKLIPTVTLTQIFRYTDGGLLNIATRIRCGEQYLNNGMKNTATTFGKNKDYIFIDKPSESMGIQAVALYKKLLNSGVDVESIRVLTAKNVGECGAIELNNMIQKVANKNCGSENCMKVGKEGNEVVYYVGDLILQKSNNYNAVLADDEENTAFVANGDTGVIKGFDKDKYGRYAVVDFDGIEVKYYQGDMNSDDVGLGYSYSIHKSQGSGVDYVIVCTPSSHTFMLNSNLLYVALTRTKKKCFHIGDIQTINRAVHKKENVERHTFMKDMLIEFNEESKEIGDEYNE